jgi:hypothetical protein
MRWHEGQFGEAAVHGAAARGRRGERYELHQWAFEVGGDRTLVTAAFAHDGVALGAENVPKRGSRAPGVAGVPACRVRVRPSR